MTAISSQEPHAEPKMEPTRTDDGTPSSDSLPKPAEIQNSTTESCLETGTSEASQRALDKANGLSQSSTGRDTTTSTLKEIKSTEPTDLPSAPPERGEVGDSTTEAGTSKETQSTPDKKAIIAESLNLTEANTTGVGTASSAKITDSLKTQGTNGNINVPAFTSEDVKDETVSDHPPSHAARSDQSNTEVKDQYEKSEGVSTPSIKEQATAPNREEDVNEQNAKYEGVVRGLKAKILSMETFANQRAREQREKIESLEAKISTVEAEYKKEIERLEGKHKKEMQSLEVTVAEMNEQMLKEIKRLQPKVSSEEDAKQPETRQARDPIKSSDEKPIDSSQPSQVHATKHSSTAANQKIDGLDQGSGIKKEKTNSLSVVPKADSLSVTEVATLVKELNAEIGQMVHLLTESLSDLELPASDNESEIAFDELHNYIGPWLCDKLRNKSEFDSLIAQLTLQTGLANACSYVVNDSPFWYDGGILHLLYKRMAAKEGPATADDWKAKTSDYLDLSSCKDASKKYLTEIVRKLATAAVRGTLKNSDSLLSQYNQQIEVITRKAAKIHKTITEDVTSSELITYTACDTEFDASQMEDSENKPGSTPHGKVICTQEMGLLCRKIVGPKKPRGSLKDWGVTMKAKVVLASTLEA